MAAAQCACHLSLPGCPHESHEPGVRRRGLATTTAAPRCGCMGRLRPAAASGPLGRGHWSDMEWRLGWLSLRAALHRPPSEPCTRHSYARAALENSTLHTIHTPYSRSCPRQGPFLRYVYVPRPHSVYRRFGEASHPGPIVRMPGEGHCLYHALAWWLGGTAHAMRQRLATLSEAQWNQFMPCNTPELLRQFRLETSDRTQWGGGPFK